MNTPFKKLLYRFHNNLATEAERRELMEMIHSGKYDEELGMEWDVTLAEAMESTIPDPVSQSGDLQAIRNRISLEDPNGQGQKRKSKLRKLAGWVSAAAAIGILVIVAGMWERTVDPIVQDKPEVIVEAEEVRTFTGKQFVKLPDGSTVLLNENSELSYHPSFGGQTREVYLTGEAFFDITHDPVVPFLVRTGEINTRVLGTAFNVEAWPGETSIKVTVTRGKVAVGDDDHVFEELTPNEQLSVNTETQEYEKTTMNAEVATEWKRSFFVLDKISMTSAAKQISERFGVEVVIENDALKNCLVNGSFFDNETVEHVVSVICLAMNADYGIDGDKVTITGGIGCE